MKVILKTNVDNLGEAGDMVEVKDGYARNFLLPRDLADEATPENIAHWEENQEELKAQLKAEREEAESLKEKLEEKEVVVKAKAGEEGRIFGSVTSQDIADAIKDQVGVEIDKKKIDLKSNIKEIGEQVIGVRVYPELVAELNLKVETE